MAVLRRVQIPQREANETPVFLGGIFRPRQTDFLR